MSTRVAPARHLLPRILLGLFILFCMYLFTRTPTHEGEWSPLQTRLPQIALHEGAEPYYHIENLRDFRYNADGSVQRADYRSDDHREDDGQPSVYLAYPLVPTHH